MGDKQPIFIMSDNSERSFGKDAQRNNILAAKLVSETVKTTLGPKGMDKMLVDGTGNITVTNDGVTILEEMDIEHPAAKMMVDIAKTQDSEVGDGTTTAVMIAGKLLENAEALLDKKIHPTVITKGYRIAAEEAKIFLNALAFDASVEDLKKIAMTSMTGKGAEDVKEKFADLIVEGVRLTGDISNIKIEKAKGESIEETELIKGIVLDKEKVSVDMPMKVHGARIALLDAALEIKTPEADAKISISSPEQFQQFVEQEERMLKEMVAKVINSGASVVFCQKGIDDVAQYYLAKQGIYACRRVTKSDMEKLAKATGAKIVSNLNELTGEQLGKSEIVEEVREGDEAMTYARGCENPKALTILIKGGTEHVMDEIERAIKDGLGVVNDVIKNHKIVVGGGAIEIEVAKKLREFSQKLGGREQLAVEEFANAMEFIPITLAENAGMDPIDVLTELKARHDAGEVNTGLNLFNGKIEDNKEQGIIEPLKIKIQAISSAVEVATMILRIDDVISSGKNKGPDMRGMGMGGGGGYPGLE